MANYKFKISIVGDGQVGKTSLIKTYTKSEFSEDYIKTIGAQFSIHERQFKGDLVELVLWDIAGQLDFTFLRGSFFKNSKASVIVFSLEPNSLGETSFENVIGWYDDIVRYCEEIPVLLVANKSDLLGSSQINQSKIDELMKKREFAGFCVTSAKNDSGVAEMFEKIIEILHTKFGGS